MSDIWLDSVDMDSISLLGHSPNHVTFDGFATLSARLFVVNDGTDAGPMFPFEAAHAFGILMGVEDNFAGPGYEWQAYFDFVQKPFPGNPFNDWTVILQPDTIPSPSSWTPIRQTEAAGNNGAAYFGGGTVSVTKDYALGHYVFTTPLGAVTVPFTWLSNQPPLRPFWVPTDTPMYSVGIGHALAYADTSVLNQEVTKWHNFYTRQNGVIVPPGSAALTAADPGFWDSPFTGIWFAVPGGGNYHQTGVLMPSASGQEATRYRTEFTAPAFPAQVYQATTEQRYIMPPGTTPAGLDVAVMPEHDLLFAGWAMDPNELMARRSHDHAHTWVNLLIETGTPASSLSLACFAGQVWICYYDGSQIVTRYSRDLALTWSSAMPVSFAGTNPRLVISPEGMFFFFYFSGTNLLLRRSTDFGVTYLDAAPIPITASLTAQDFGAVWAADRRLVVSYVNGANWESKYSLDLGSSWALV
jgi:hypothetical protein